jgi:hypothetical protein
MSFATTFRRMSRKFAAYFLECSYNNNRKVYSCLWPISMGLPGFLLFFHMQKFFGREAETNYFLKEKS